MVPVVWGYMQQNKSCVWCNKKKTTDTSTFVVLVWKVATNDQQLLYDIVLFFARSLRVGTRILGLRHS